MKSVRSFFAAGTLCLGISASVLAADGSGVFFPEKQVGLYPSHHGEPVGYPGVLDEKTAEGAPKFVKWGQPEPQLYAGSVEHYRCESQKYLPSWPMFEATSLVKNFRLTELPGVPAAAVEEYAEPVYYLPMYGPARDTGKRNAPAKVVRCKTGAPRFAMELGDLTQGLYCIRLVGAAETQYTKGIRAPVYVELTVNDGPAGEVSRYRKRCGYTDEFYSVAEFYFYAPARRIYKAEMYLGEGSKVDILAYNIDLHDMYKGIVREPVKKGIGTFDLAVREAARAALKEKLAAADKAWLADYRKKNLIEYDITKPFRPQPLTGEARAQRDDEIWHAVPPMNAQTYGQYGTAPRGIRLPETAEAVKEFGQWELSRKWDSRWEINLVKDKKVVATYTWDDLAAHKPLPEPWPFREDAGGITFAEPAEGQKYPATLCTIANFTTQRLSDFTEKLTGRAAHWAGMANFYHFTGDTEAARDAAMALVRVAYLLPAWDESRLSVNAAIVGETADLNWGGKDQWTRRRLTRTNAGIYNTEYLNTYDRLFDYIQGNEELAQAVSRHIPWIKTSKDLVTFLDMNLLQYTAKRMARWHLHHNDLFDSVMATASTDFTRPWMEFLFRETYVYPNARAGMPDYAITSTQRDGTSYIGSWFYAMGGGAAMDYAEKTDDYVARGGDPKFDMSDFNRFPKALAACNFQIEGRAAGLHPLGVGDVHGPNMTYGHWFTLGPVEKQARLGWKWSKDPKYAYILANYFSPTIESPEEWAAIQKAAEGVVNPWFIQRSRVLNNWAGILESGTQHTDFRFRRAAMVRVGYGWGHQHDDVLNLILWCHGVIHAATGGERPEQRKLGDVHEPKDQASYIQNMVEVDGFGGARDGRHRGASWIRGLVDAEGARYMMAQAYPFTANPYVSLYRRQVALVDLNEGTPLEKQPSEAREFHPAFKLPAVEKTADAYVFDVFRVRGGKRHTYCFHGPEEDEFTSNAVGVRPLGFNFGNNADATPAAHYLRKFVVADSKTAGKAPAVLQATWRLQRGGDPLALTIPEKDAQGVDQPTGKKEMPRANTEQRILGPNYDAASPRKFTRLHLFEHEGGDILTGKWVATSPNVALQCLYAQRNLPGELPEGQTGDLQSVFPAIIEMYESQPVIQSARSLAIKDNDTDALRAVAVELTLPDGRKDVCFADGRPEKLRVLEDGTSAVAEFGYASYDNAGIVRQMTLAGGTLFSILSADAPERTGRVVAVDYMKKTAVVEGLALTNPALLSGSAIEVGLPEHMTTYMVKDASVDGNRVTLRFDKGMDFYSSRVSGVDEAARTVRCGLGFPTDDGNPYEGVNKGLVASNESQTKFWRAEYVGGTREDGYDFKLDGPVTAADFGEKGGLRIWEIGVGDTVRQPTFVSLRRTGENAWTLQANAACEIGLPSNELQVSADAKAWRDAPAAKEGMPARFSEKDLGSGTLHLRMK